MHRRGTDSDLPNVMRMHWYGTVSGLPNENMVNARVQDRGPAPVHSPNDDPQVTGLKFMLYMGTLGTQHGDLTTATQSFVNWWSGLDLLSLYPNSAEL